MAGASFMALIGGRGASFANTLISQTGGTFLSNMISGGSTDPSSAGQNIGCAFDGTTSQGAANSPYRIAAANCYIGRNLATPSLISKVEYYPTNDVGFSGDGIGNMTVTLYGKVGAFVNETTGTVLATQSGIARTSTALVTLTNTTDFSLFDRWWVYLVTASGTGNIFCAEARAYN